MAAREPAFHRPPVRTTESGVRQVLPSDIIRSEVGQAVIRRAAAMRFTPPPPASPPNPTPDAEGTSA